MVFNPALFGGAFGATKKKKGQSPEQIAAWSGFGLDQNLLPFFKRQEADQAIKGIGLAHGVMGQLAPSLDAAHGSLAGALGAAKELPGVVNRGFDAAQAQVGAIGVAGQRRARERGQQQLGQMSQMMARSGLGGSSVAANLSRGIQADVARQQGEVDAQMASIRANLEAGRTQALAGAAQARAAGLGALADFWLQKAQLQQRTLFGTLGIAQDQTAQRQQKEQAMAATLGGAASSVGTAAVLGGACCFIFLEARYGDGTMDRIVRRYRDEHMTERNRRGYYKLAEVLVPLMRRSRIVKAAVRWGMVAPLIGYGRWHYGEGRVGRLCAPLARWWLRLFDYLGGEHPFVRENGEVV